MRKPWRAPGFCLYFLLKQSVLVAVVIEISSATQLQAGFGVTFGIELDHLHTVVGYERQKGYKMLLGHGVGDGDKMLVLHFFYGDPVVVVYILRFQSRQGNATAADHRIARAVNGISANGTDIEPTP